MVGLALLPAPTSSPNRASTPLPTALHTLPASHNPPPYTNTSLPLYTDPLGTIVNGTIASVSPLMNVALRTVKFTTRGRDTLTLDSITVRGSTVRYIILPDSLPLDTLLIDDAPKPKNKARKETDRGGRGGGGRGGPRGRGGRGGRGRGRGRGM